MFEDHCFYKGFLQDCNDPSGTMSTTPLLLILYIDNFVIFSEDPEVGALFCCLLSRHCKVNSMGIVEWFLGIHFSWRFTPSSVLVHLIQSGFAANLVVSIFCETGDPTPMATPYCSGILIDSIAPSTDNDASPAQICHKDAYQSLISSIGWLAMSAQPDLSVVYSFLSLYSNKLAASDMKAALYALHYIHFMHGYGCSSTHHLCVGLNGWSHT
jgi:hypothetical protein